MKIEENKLKEIYAHIEQAVWLASSEEYSISDRYKVVDTIFEHLFLKFNIEEVD